MANEVNLSEVLITPAARMIREIGASVAEAQRVLDAEAMASQAALEKSNPDLFKAGYQVTWYQIPEADAEAARRKPAELGKQVTDAQAVVAPREADLKSARQALAGAGEQADALRKELEAAKAHIADLLGRIGPAAAPRPKIPVDQLV